MTGLCLRDLSLSFGGVQAVRGLSLTVSPGEICALVGPNGAGKTSVINLVTRVVQPAAGRMHFGGVDLARLARHELVRHGIARSFQTVELFDRCTVLEHLLLGSHRHARAGFWSQCLNLPGARRDRRDAHRRAEAVMDRLGLSALRHRVVAELPQGDRRLVELGRALATEPSLLLLDEPAAGLGAGQVAALAHCLQALRGGCGLAVLMVEHNMALVEAVAERVVVMSEGQWLAAGTPASVRADPRVRDLYLGA